MTGELFNPEAFEQIPGQIAFEQCDCGMPPENGGHAPACQHYAKPVPIDNSAATVEARRQMFASFGWSVTR